VRRTLLTLALTATLVAGCGGGDEAAGGDSADGDATTTTGAERDATADEGSTTSVGEAPPDDPLGGFVPEPLDWDGCGGRTECATLVVPLDWERPDGPTIELAVTRIPAESGEAEGAIATNPGGPGGSGNEFLGSGVFAEEIAERFDQLSWDPRGVGGSTPLDCDEDVIDDFVRLDPDPDTPEEATALDAGAQAVGTSCAAGSGDLLPYVGTGSVARDLEAIHRAYGGPMGYVGFSYGTSIGLQYLALFGGTMEHGVVLDGVVDPTDSQTELLRGQAVAFESILDGVLEEAGIADDYDALAAQLEVAPIDADGDELVPSDLTTAAIYALYLPELHEVLVDGVAEALDGDGATLIDLAEAYRDSGGFGIYQAVSCTDSANPVGSEAWTAFADELEALAPRTGAGVANEMRPCAFWPVPPRPITGDVVAAGSGPVLVIGTTGHPGRAGRAGGGVPVRRPPPRLRGRGPHGVLRQRLRAGRRRPVPPRRGGARGRRPLLSGAQATVSVPVMLRWISQWKAYSPGSLGAVSSPESPPPMLTSSQASSSEVTVWVVLSSLVTVTGSPPAAVTELNAKPEITMPPVPAASPPLAGSSPPVVGVSAPVSEPTEPPPAVVPVAASSSSLSSLQAPRPNTRPAARRMAEVRFTEVDRMGRP
jgi:pimeloyl-ACP methyl ester carboxylesterase